LLKNQSIKKVVAAVMLIVFAFSVTPTIFLHNWVANHKDSVNRSAAAHKEQVSKKLFSCHCDNIVAESPFTEPDVVILVPAIQIFSLQKFDKRVCFSSSQYIFFSRRGPPAV
jgi:hypothetical protein